MARYAPLGDVMPAASMVTGAVVSAALCDQMRDNLVALRDGWWFRATRSTNLTTTAVTLSTLPLDTLTLSQTAEDDGSLSLESGVIRVRRTGLWMVGGHYCATTTDVLLISVQVTPSLTSLVFEEVSDTTNSKAAICGSGTVEVTTAEAFFTLAYYTGSSVSITANSVTIGPLMWGVWLGDLP